MQPIQRTLYSVPVQEEDDDNHDDKDPAEASQDDANVGSGVLGNLI